MAVNFYETPAQADFLSQYVPIPFDELYRVGTALNIQNQTYADKLDQFYKDHRNFQSPSAIDTQNYYDMTLGYVEPVARELASNPDLIKTPEGRSLINSTLRNVPYQEISKIMQSRDSMLTRQQMEAKLSLEGRYNPDWHGRNYGIYDTTSSGIFNDLNLVPYSSVKESSNQYFDALKDSFIKTEGGYDYYGVNDDVLHKTAVQNVNAYADSQIGKEHMKSFMRNNPGATETDAKQWLAEEMYQGAMEYRRVNRSLNDMTKFSLMYAGRGSNRKSGSGDETPSGPLSYRETRLNTHIQKQENVINSLLDKQKDKPVSLNRNMFNGVVSALTSKDAMDVVNKNPQLLAAQSRLLSFINGFTDDGSGTKAKPTVGQVFNEMDEAVKSGILPKQISDMVRSQLGYDMSGDMTADLQSQIARAAITGDENVLQAFREAKVPIIQEVVHQFLGGPNQNKKMWTPDSDGWFSSYKSGAIPPSSNASNVVETHVRPNSMYTTKNGIPLTELSKAYMNGEFKLPKANDKNTKTALDNLPGLLDYIMYNSGRRMDWSASDESFRYTGNDKTPHEYVQGVQYLPKNELKEHIKNYIESTGLKGLSVNNYLDILLNGKLGNERTLGYEIGDMSMGRADSKGDPTESSKKKDMVGLYLSMPIDEMFVDPYTNREIEGSFAKPYSAKPTDYIMEKQDLQYTFPEEIRQQLMMEQLMQQQGGQNSNFREQWQ